MRRFHGTAGPDDLDVTTVLSDLVIVWAGGGDDRVFGSLATPNLLIGKGGDDTLIGGAAPDLLAGGDGRDSMAGGGGNDVLLGGRGNDDISGRGGGTDRLYGGGGNDAFDLTAVTSLVGWVVDGGSGDDGADLFGGDVRLGTTLPFVDVERIDTYLTVFHGTGGADSYDFTGIAAVAFGGSWSLTLRAGRGDDTVLGATSSTGNNLSGADGNDSLVGGSSVDSLFGGAGDDTLLGHAGSDVLVGGTGRDRLVGGDGLDRLGGGEGDDSLSGGEGDDWLSGDRGRDTLAAGQGNDTYVVDDPGDVVQEASGEGVDLLQAMISIAALPDNIENLTLLGGAPIAGAGNALDNVITGNPGDNVLSGGAGNDNLWGGGGTDRLYGETGNDAFNLTLDSNLAGWVVDGGSGDDGADLFGGDVQLGTTLPFVSVERIDTYLTVFRGTAGADSYDFTGMAAVAFGGSWSLTLRAGLGDDTVLGATSSVGNILSGEGGNDSLAGNGAADTLSGGAGDDTLVGGAGADQLIGGTGADVFRFGSATEGGDTIVQYVGSDDTVAVSAAGFGGGLVAGSDIVATGHYAENTTGAATSAAGVGQFVLETDTGWLWWDADGGGGAAGVRVALIADATGWAGTEIVAVA